MDKIEEKIAKLKQEIQKHQMQLNNAQQVVNVETRNMIAKSGAIEVLKELKEKPKPEKPSEKPEEEE